MTDSKFHYRCNSMYFYKKKNKYVNTICEEDKFMENTKNLILGDVIRII